jgi:hypothetical protein
MRRHMTNTRRLKMDTTKRGGALNKRRVSK